ncbi:hypothetical protein RND81_11G158400 [Saponaria officinalis]|uniref:Uncharacterized protein n=1 Tax=Saponaria officinalis TaxID=3572 RepID=A0AAW1HLN6_SAPOF
MRYMRRGKSTRHEKDLHMCSATLAHVFSNSNQPPSPDHACEENKIPAGIFQKEIIATILDYAEFETKKNMGEVCRQWAAWFLLEGPRSYMEYETTLVKEETKLSITLWDGDLIVQEHCKCRDAGTEEERLRIHRQRWPEHEAAAWFVHNGDADTDTDEDQVSTISSVDEN